MDCQRRWEWKRGLTAGVMLAVCVGACGRTGFSDRDQLETYGQGPSACVKSCEQLGMRMAALVLVGGSESGCVCQPLTMQPAGPLPAAVPDQSQSVNDGAAASTTGYVVLAAAAAAAREQQDQQRRHAQQSTKH